MKPILQLYRGYANGQELIVMGHVFKTDYSYDFQKKNFKNATSVINQFRIKTIKNFDLYLHYDGQEIHTKTLDDGHFKFCIPIENESQFGWNEYEVSMKYEEETISSTGSFIRPHKGNLGIISDIDDTFLISHTHNFFKKIYILLFKNVNDRKVFKDVVPYYQALSSAGRNNQDEQNAFFYISSSEWNLYRFIVEFTKIHELPRAVILLKDIKRGITDFFMSGRGNHDHKFEKIKHVLEFYPNLKYILLGDDSQHDPMLYERTCKIFPLTVKAVYIRQTGKYQKEAIKVIMSNLESLNISVCYFKESSEAIMHSKSIGIIK
ncbi:App1 family protein [Flavobacterium sp. Fl-77]|uniref:App1 family protein n=1 Tax=Flavobacterium flavipigmentatum TaxID=2893884 RepID=A0AAJ2SHW0_9FLAO|nr:MULTISPECIES: App1 family protein [unclassified Flavobacterium]MDX6183180.1 App1 family protein [Flavobacterium sp. Fl-33]MDX6186751.1 App1 family protein [Flavobacterium sp. Fl-77]UFH40405.1 App1 family protein [Flavobacterium sp. F-70]